MSRIYIAELTYYLVINLVIKMVTPIAGIPELSEYQAAKYLTHNDALRQLEVLTLGQVKSNLLTSPPLTPAEGDVYIPAAGATGAWTGLANKVVVYSNSQWIAYNPFIGLRLLHWDLSRYFYWDGTQFLVDNRYPFVLTQSISSTYTLASSDHASWLICSGSFSIVLPNGLPNGFYVSIFNEGIGTITLSPSGGVLTSKGTKLTITGSACQALHKASNDWIATGDLTV